VTKITSRLTFYYKWIFPILWFGFIAFFMVSSFLDERHEPEPVFYLVPAVMALFGFVLMKKLVWDLMDEVYDCGDSLLIRNRGEEERINLSNIINVNVSSNTNPRRISLRLDKPGRLGNEIAFSPESRGFSINPFAKNKIGEDLIVRVDRARVKRAV
jgi:hypothetical protein